MAFLGVLVAPRWNLDTLIGERGNVGEGPETMSLLKIVSFIMEALQVYGMDKMHPVLNEA